MEARALAAAARRAARVHADAAATASASAAQAEISDCITLLQNGTVQAVFTDMPVLQWMVSNYQARAAAAWAAGVGRCCSRLTQGVRAAPPRADPQGVCVAHPGPQPVQLCASLRRPAAAAAGGAA